MKKNVLDFVIKGIATCLAVVAIIGGLFLGLKAGNVIKGTIGKESVSIDREIFKENKSYVEGMVNDLADYKREFERASDEEEKKQIANYIDSHFANFDATLIENNTLYKFLMDIRNGNY